MQENVIITRTPATAETLLEINRVIRKIEKTLSVEEAKTLFYTEKELKEMEKSKNEKDN